MLDSPRRLGISHAGNLIFIDRGNSPLRQIGDNGTEASLKLSAGGVEVVGIDPALLVGSGYFPVLKAVGMAALDDGQSGFLGKLTVRATVDIVHGQRGGADGVAVAVRARGITPAVVGAAAGELARLVRTCRRARVNEIRCGLSDLSAGNAVLEASMR